MTVIKALVCSFLLFLVGLGSCAVEEAIEPSVVHGRNYNGRVIRAITDLGSIAAALEMYKLDNFAHPSSDQGLRALVEKPTGAPEPSNWGNGYLRSLQKDPWGQHYLYVESNDHFSLYSAGKNGIDEFQLGDDIVRGDKEYSCETYGMNCPHAFIDLAKLVSLIILGVGFISTVTLSIFVLIRWLIRRSRRV